MQSNLGMCPLPLSIAFLGTALIVTAISQCGAVADSLAVQERVVFYLLDACIGLLRIDSKASIALAHKVDPCKHIADIQRRIPDRLVSSAANR